MEQRLQGKVALITGGGTGIGAATARALAAAGAKVVVTGRRAALIESVAKETGGIAVAGDVGDAAHAKQAVGAALKNFGGLDILVANAGIENFGSVGEIDLAAFHEVMRTNVDGVLLAAQASLESMKSRGGGAIVVVSSVAGLFGAPHYASYCTSKAALLGLARSICIDYGPYGIRVNTVCPGWILTEIAERALQNFADVKKISLEQMVAAVIKHYPLRRMGSPAEIAATIAFLASTESSFITGAVLTADGGSSCVDLGTLAFG